MNITVGATGMIGSRIADQLEQSGHHVQRASRSHGIDAAGLGTAFEATHVVVDCLNIETLGAQVPRVGLISVWGIVDDLTLEQWLDGAT